MPVALVSGRSFSANYNPAADGSVTFDWSAAFTPTTGNTLVFFMTTSTGPTGIDTGNIPSGWTLVHESGTGGTFSGFVLIKENCSSSDTSIAVRALSAASGIACVREYSGGKTSGIVDANGKAEDQTNINGAVTSQSSGTTGTRSQANGLAIAFIGCDNGGNLGNDTWTASFVGQVYANRATTSGFRVAELAVSDTGAKSTTLTMSAADQAYGVILILDEASGGAAGSVAFRRAFPLPVLNF